MMRAPFTLRAATPHDVAEVSRLVRGLAEYEKLENQFVATHEDFHRHLFGPNAIAHAALAEVAGTPVGLALWYYTFNTFAGRRRLFVEDVFVEPAHRGQGIGFSLFRHMAKIARAENCAQMEWHVLNWNQPSIDFYHRVGARPVTDWTTMRLRGEAFAQLAS